MGRRRFTREFKIDAVRRVLEGKDTMASIARELGIAPGLLGIWKREFFEEASEGLSAGKNSFVEEERLRLLERRVRELEEENSFLKKTAAYFAQQERRGTK